MNLIQLALAAEELFQEQPAIEVVRSRCVRARNIHATCNRCVEVCPTEAVGLAAGLPDLAVEQCIRCGACVQVCPVGALEREDGLYKLLRCVEALPDHKVIDLTCAHHPAPASGDQHIDAVIQIGSCLSELGPASYVGLLALGVERIRVRTDACAECPLRLLVPCIEAAASDGQQCARAVTDAGSIELVTAAESGWRQRMLYHSQQPPVSRRGFFSLFAPEATSVARRIAFEENFKPEGKHISRERQRLLVALRLLAANHAGSPADTKLEASNFTTLSVSQACTACGVCERVCPTGALRVDKCGDRFSVVFAAHACTVCDLCVVYCEPGAVTLAGSPLTEIVLAGIEGPVHQGSLRTCSRCAAQFAGPEEAKLCPVCQFRRTDPTGVRLPEALLAQLPEATRKRLAHLTNGPDMVSQVSDNLNS